MKVCKLNSQLLKDWADNLVNNMTRDLNVHMYKEDKVSKTIEILTPEQKVKQLEFAVQMLEYDLTEIENVDTMLKMVLDSLIDNRTNLLKQTTPTMEETLLQECRARLFLIIESI